MEFFLNQVPGVISNCARAKSIQGTVAQGTKQVAHGVVTHTKSAADSLQTGLETSVKVVGEAANAAASQAKV
ncbi:hypothetical protein ANCCAN_09002 [Ancylostoma caninum]|uniref:Uncharacterized protein n=1 Tax=Ancylostoma caninum TaxID=29170 RepID=A0A368GQ20_ANCCA|nr:hypothetical protein ANCCAN_09002 [Ancylostoma caninum]